MNREGILGNCRWEFDDERCVLTISPIEGTDGMLGETGEDGWPWCDFSYDICGVVIKDGVVCSSCGSIPAEDAFLPGMCDAHTHGLKERGFTELQMVIAYPEDTISYVINTIVKKVLSGEVMQKDGMFVDKIFADGAGIRLDLRKDHYGEDVYRIVLPDRKFRMPEDSDEYPYNMQSKSPYIKDTIIF